jgi:hypothetical protein
MPLSASREPTPDDLAFGFVGCRVFVRGGDPQVRANIAAALGRCRVGLDEDSPPTDATVAAFEIGGSAGPGYSLKRHDGPSPFGPCLERQGYGSNELEGPQPAGPLTALTSIPLPFTAGTAPDRAANVHQSSDSNSTDGELLADNLSAFDLRERLVYEVTLALARGVRDWTVVHAAGLAWGGIGIILAGVSGAGKSTLATRLLALGGELLSDELVAISPDGGKMVGFPRPVVLKDGGRALGMEWLSSRLGAGPQPEPDGAVRIDPARFAVSRGSTAPAPRLLVFPRYVPDAPITILPLTRAAAIYRLLPGLMNAPAFADRGLGAMAGALGAIRAYGLEYGDGETALQALVDLVIRT